MRNGSTNLGSVGTIVSRFVSLILPWVGAVALCAAVSTPTWAAKSGNSHKAASAGKTQTQHKQAKKPGATLTALQKQAVERRARALKPTRVIQTRATWYGPGFHGRRTASGERFDSRAMTLASRHLPFGTLVRVTNLRNGRTVVGRVNDRGPYGSRAVTADLSAGMARRIGLTGTCPVKLEILPKGAKSVRQAKKK